MDNSVVGYESERLQVTVVPEASLSEEDTQGATWSPLQALGVGGWGWGGGFGASIAAD